MIVERVLEAGGKRAVGGELNGQSVWLFQPLRPGPVDVEDVAVKQVRVGSRASSVVGE